MMTVAEQVRSFIAIEMPDELRMALGRIQARLKEAGQPSVKWVDPDNIHLTLKFLGNTDVNIISKISRVMEKAAQGIPPFRLELGGLGVFPDLRRVQIVWIGLDGDLEQLKHLQQRIESNLAPLGFASESRPFKPHLTLARFRDRATLDERQNLGQIIASTHHGEDYSFNVDSVNLMKSQLTRAGAIYSLMSSVNLKKNLANNR